MDGTYWFYDQTGNRTLLVQAEDAKENKSRFEFSERFDNRAKTFRQLGATACKAL